MKLKLLSVAGLVLLSLLAFAAWIFWPSDPLQSAATTIDELYVQYRPFLYRWNGAGFAPAKKAQSATCIAVSEKKVSRARKRIEGVERRSGQTAQTQRLLGRIDLLRCDTSAAESKYKLALFLQPDDPSLNLERGIAFALEAAADRQLKDVGALDYEAAMEAVLRSGRLSQSPEFLFDSALLFEEARLPLQAREQWMKVEAVENSPQWLKEAQERRGELESGIEKRGRKIRKFSSSPDVVLNAEIEKHRVLRLSSWTRAAPNRDDDIRDGSELGLDAAVQEWLPKMDTASVSRRDLEELGKLLVSYHGDRWLLDVLKASPSSETQDAFNSLALAVKNNLTGEHPDAAKWAQKAEDSFHHSHNFAGELRARVEKAYAFARVSNTEDCQCALKELRRDAEQRSYTWIAAQAWLGDNYCRTLTRREDVIKSRRDAFVWIGAQTHYEGLRLRALGFMTEEYVSADSRLTLWREGEQGLRDFWDEPLPALRGYSLYYTLADSARQAGNSNTAIAFLREGSLLLKGDVYKLLSASMLGYLGARQLEANLTKEANKSFDEMDEEYAALSPGAKQGFRGESEVIHAAALISTGNLKEGFKRLEQLTASSAWPWPFKDLVGRVRRPLFPALGDAYLRLNRQEFNQPKLDPLREACKNYRQSIREAMEKLQDVHDPEQRDNGLHEIEPAWRGMTSVMLKQNRAGDALAVWEEFRSSRHFTDIEALHQNPDCSPRAKKVHFPTTDGVTILVYAFLPDGLSGWIVNRHGTKLRIEQHSIDVSRVPALASRFAELVATKDSPPQNVSAVSRELYGLLLRPFADILPPEGTFIIDAEGVLAGIPWQALEDDNGRPLIERFSLCQTVGLADVLRGNAAPQIDLSKALVFGSPALPEDLAKRFPVLQDSWREVDKLRALSGSRVLEGKDATAEAFREYAPESTHFHFAGHGVSYGGFGALLLAPLAGGGSANDAYFTAHEIADIGSQRTQGSRKVQGLQRLQLVVLASCSSGVGEQSGIVDLDSLTRAFLEAGAQRVIASSWEVDSSATAKLMAEFYDRLENGTTTAESLRQGQMEVRQKWRHPYYWAAFRVFGRP